MISHTIHVLKIQVMVLRTLHSHTETRLYALGSTYYRIDRHEQKQAPSSLVFLDFNY